MSKLLLSESHEKAVKQNYYRKSVQPFSTQEKYIEQGAVRFLTMSSQE